MKIECEYNPEQLVHEIGDPHFSIDEEKTKDTHRVEINDCEYETKITISCCEPYNAIEIAEALLKLLNQDYRPVGENED